MKSILQTSVAVFITLILGVVNAAAQSPSNHRYPNGIRLCPRAG